MSYTTLSHMDCTVLNSTIEYSLKYFIDHIIRETTLFFMHHPQIIVIWIKWKQPFVNTYKYEDHT